METGINLGISIKTRVRIQVLYDVIKELSSAFNFPNNTLKILHKGIVERQLLGSVFAHYLDGNGESVGIVQFNIDWKKHKMYANTTTGKQIEIQTDKPLIEQFATWSNDIVKYVQIMQKELNVKKIVVYYRYIDEVRNDAIADKEADEFLGLSSSSKDIKYNIEKSESFERKMSFISNMLPELEIKVQSKK